LDRRKHGPLKRILFLGLCLRIQRHGHYALRPGQASARV
jgi:hypothetical protein